MSVLPVWRTFPLVQSTFTVPSVDHVIIDIDSDFDIEAQYETPTHLSVFPLISLFYYSFITFYN